MVRSRATFTPSPARGCTPAPTDVVMMMPVMMPVMEMMTISMKMRKITTMINIMQLSECHGTFLESACTYVGFS